MSGALSVQEIVRSRLVPLVFTSCYNDGTPPRANGVTLLTTDREDTPTMADESVPQRVSVYKVTCLVNDKQYIGITARTAAWRFDEHIADAVRGKSQRPLMQAIQKHGADNFIVEVVCVALGRRNAHLLERELIVEYGTIFPAGYNLTSGGEGLRGWRWHEESRRLASERHKGRSWTPEMRAKMAVIQGTPEYRAKMRAANKKRKHYLMSDEQRESVRQSTIRQFADPIRRKAISDKAKDRMADPSRRLALSMKASENWADDGYRARHAEAMTRVLASEEYINNRRAEIDRRMANEESRKARNAKISASVKARFQDPEYRARYDAGRRSEKNIAHAMQLVMSRAESAREKKSMVKLPSVFKEGD